MKQRSRDIRKLVREGHHRFQDVESFTSSSKVLPGLTSVLSMNRWFDFLYEDRGSDVTLVTFTAALPRSLETYPRFSAAPRASDLGVNFLGFADPAQGSAESLSTFWHLSTKRVDTNVLVPAVVQKLLVQHPDRKFVFFGSSAGGFAALNYSARFPDSTAFVMNPRINIMHYPLHFPEYVVKAHPGSDPDRVARRATTDIATLYKRPHGNRVVYLQNLQDEHYMEHHYSHFQKVVDGREDVQFITGDWGKGHVAPPRQVFMSALRDVVSTIR